MTDVQDATDRKVKWLRYLRWGLALAGMTCWTILVGTAGLCSAAGAIMTPGGHNPPHDAEFYWQIGMVFMFGGAALALAPWVIGGIMLGVRRRRSRASEAPQATE